MNSDIDEHAPTAAIGIALLRVVTGVVVGGHALEKLMHLREFQGELIQVGMPRPEFVAFIILAMELGASLMLLMGRYTRVAALATLCDALIAIAIIGLQHRAIESHVHLESAALMGAASFYLVTSGYGWFGTSLLRRRARMQALSEAGRWQRQPLAEAAAETVVYETPEGLVYEAPVIDPALEAMETLEPRRRFRRRWFERHANG